MNRYEVTRGYENRLIFHLGNVTVISSVPELRMTNPRGSGQTFLDAITTQYQGIHPEDERLILNGVQAHLRSYVNDNTNIYLEMPSSRTIAKFPVTLQLTNFIRDLAAIIDE